MANCIFSEISQRSYLTFLVRSFCSNTANYSGLQSSSNIKPVKMSFYTHDAAKSNNINSDPPLVIMHGLFGSKNNWNSLSKAINNITGKKVVAVDARNHGESPHTEDFSYHLLVEDIRHLIDDLGMRQVNLLGHSMGGRAVMLYALTYPETVNKLIVVDISHISASNQMAGMEAYFKAMSSVKFDNRLLMSEVRKKTDEYLSKYIPEDEIRQFLLTNLIHKKGNYTWRMNLSSLRKAFQSAIMNFPHVTNVCDKPTLFIGGKKSDYLRVEDEVDILKLFPEAEFKYLDAGHWLHAEKPDEFINLVKNFINLEKS